MKRFVWGLSLLLMTAFMFVGCAPKQSQAPGQQVAGKQEQYNKPTTTTTTTSTTTKPTMVTVTISDKNITVTPSSVPAGNLDVMVKNTSKTPQVFHVAGEGTNVKPVMLKPGATTTIHVMHARPGSFTLTAPKTSMHGQTMTNKLMVTQPSGTTGTVQKTGTTGTAHPTTTKPIPAQHSNGTAGK